MYAILANGISNRGEYWLPTIIFGAICDIIAYSVN